MNKKILFITNTLKVGGAAKMMYYVSDLCEKSGYIVYRVSMFDNDMNDLTKGQYNLAIEHERVSWRIPALHRIRRVIKELQPDIVCAFVSDVAFTTRIATMGLDIVFTAAERGDPYTLNVIWRNLIKWTYRHSNFCFFQLNKARDFFGKEVINKSFVIPNSFVPTIAPFDGEREKVIVSAGRFVPEKGYDTLIKAFSIVHESHPDYTLKLYGEGPEKENYIRLSVELGIDDYISYPGYSHNLSKDMCNSSVYVLSSKYEGIPNSLIEAMACGIPTVSTNCTPGGPAFLTDNETRGLLVPVDDVEAMAMNINRIIDSPDIANQLSCRGLEVVEMLAPEKIDHLWDNAFQAISESRR